MSDLAFVLRPTAAEMRARLMTIAFKYVNKAQLPGLSTHFLLYQGGPEARGIRLGHVGGSQSIGSSTGPEHALDVAIIKESHEFRGRQDTVRFGSA